LLIQLFAATHNKDVLRYIFSNLTCKPMYLHVVRVSRSVGSKDRSKCVPS